MMRDCFAALGIAVVAAVAPGCGDDGVPSDAGMDATSDADAMDAGPDVPADTALGPRGCLVDGDCESGACFHPLSELGRGVGYCTTTCEADADCDALDVDGFDATCVEVSGDESRCLRTCPFGFGCPDDNVCLTSAAVGVGRRADVCVDLSLDTCDSDADCASDSFCKFFLADREKVVAACFTPLDTAGRPAMGLRAGQRCDPRTDAHDYRGLECEVPEECPAGWTCEVLSYTDATNRCFPPLEEQCLFAQGQLSPNALDFFCRDGDYCGCLDAGLCGGICRSDADCGDSMRCSQATITAQTQGNFFVFDDNFLTAPFCTYAAGSRNPCVRESDCATTGAGGSRETCKWGTDLAGAPSGICVTPPSSVALPGEPCGDDPLTPPIEERPCINECVAGVCAGACEVDSDCGAGSTCVEFLIDESASGGMCVSAAVCEANDDCATGEVCRVFVTATGGLQLCAPPRGTLDGGADCELGFEPELGVPYDRRCASRPCDHTISRCTQYCGDDADCPIDYRCETVEVTINGRGTLDRSDDITATYGLCELAEGSLAGCTVDTDCAASEGCRIGTSMGAPIRECVNTQSVTGVGESCATRCQSPFGCIADYVTLASFCPGACESDADCSDAGLVCRRYANDRIDVEWSLCVEATDPRGSPL